MKAGNSFVGPRKALTGPALAREDAATRSRLGVKRLTLAPLFGFVSRYPAAKP